MTYYSKNKTHMIDMGKTLQPMKYDELPEETACAFIGQMDPFPIGEMLWLKPKHMDEPALFYQATRESFFSATIDQILDLYAQRLNRMWRKEQTAKIKKLYWRKRRQTPATDTA